MGGGIGMGNTCKPMAVLFQCMTKFTTNKKKYIWKKKKEADPGNVDMCPSAYGLGGGHHGDCGLVTSGAGFEKWSHSWDC